MLSMGIDISLGDTILRVSNCVPKVQLFSSFLDLDQHLVDWPLHSKKDHIVVILSSPLTLPFRPLPLLWASWP